jgi:hypothetical protein
MRLILLCLAFLQLAAGQSLSGLWDFRWDPDSKGEKSGWQNSTAAEGWTKIQVPGSFDQTFRDSISYQGKAWYRTSFRVGPGHVFLRFKGVAIRCKVWVNGTPVGEHLFPYTGFEFEVTKAVRPDSSNLLVVLVDNSILEKAIPDQHWWGWWDQSGRFCRSPARHLHRKRHRHHSTNPQGLLGCGTQGGWSGKSRFGDTGRAGPQGLARRQGS